MHGNMSEDTAVRRIVDEAAIGTRTGGLDATTGGARSGTDLWVLQRGMAAAARRDSVSPHDYHRQVMVLLPLHLLD